MGRHEQFVDKLKQGKFQEAITQALADAIELEITTWVVSGDSLDMGTTSKSTAQPGQRLKTRINIVDGDIEYEVGRDFLDGPYACLRSFHEEQVDRGTEIIRDNLEAVQTLFNALMDGLENQSTRSPEQLSAGLPAIALPHRETAIQVDLEETQHPIDELVEVDSVELGRVELESINPAAIAPLELNPGQDSEAVGMSAGILEQEPDIVETTLEAGQLEPDRSEWMEPDMASDREADRIVEGLEDSLQAAQREIPQDESLELAAIAPEFPSLDSVSVTTEPPDSHPNAPPSVVAPDDPNSTLQTHSLILDEIEAQLDAQPEPLPNIETQQNNEPLIGSDLSDGSSPVVGDQDDIVVDSSVDLTRPTLADTASPASTDTDDLTGPLDSLFNERSDYNDDFEDFKSEQSASTPLTREATINLGESQPNTSQEWDTEITDDDLEMLSPDALDSVLSMPLDDEFLDTEAKEMSEEEFSALLQAEIDDPWDAPTPESSPLEDALTVVESKPDYRENSEDTTMLRDASPDQEEAPAGIDGEEEDDRGDRTSDDLLISRQITLQNESIEPDDTLIQQAEQPSRLFLKVTEASQSSTILQLSQPSPQHIDTEPDAESKSDDTSLPLPLVLPLENDEGVEQIDPDLKILMDWVASTSLDEHDSNPLALDRLTPHSPRMSLDPVAEMDRAASLQSVDANNRLVSALPYPDIDLHLNVDDLEQSISSLSIELTDDALEDFQAFLEEGDVEDTIVDSDRDNRLAPEFAQSLDDLPMEDDNDSVLSLDELLADAESNLPETLEDSSQESSQNWLDLLIIDDEAETVDEESNEFVSQEQRLEVLFNQDFNSEMNTEPDLPDDLLQPTEEDLDDRSLANDLGLVDSSSAQGSHDISNTDGDRNDADEPTNSPDSTISPNPIDPDHLTES